MSFKSQIPFIGGQGERRCSHNGLTIDFSCPDLIFYITTMKNDDRSSCFVHLDIPRMIVNTVTDPFDCGVDGNIDVGTVPWSRALQVVVAARRRKIFLKISDCPPVLDQI